MPGKHQQALRIDRRTTPALASGDAPSASYVAADPAPPAATQIPPPRNLALTTALTRSSASPTAAIYAEWDVTLVGVEPDSYQVQLATDSGFTQIVRTEAAFQDSATIDTLKTNTLYYVRVRAIYRGVYGEWTKFTNTVGVDKITTPQDTTSPDPVTSQAASFIGAGDLVVTWANPTSANFKDAEIKIYASNGGALLATVYDATGRYVWTAAQNLAATSNVGDPSLYVELRARSWGNVLSAAVNVSATKAVPSTPGSISHTWSGDTGTAGADWTIAWGAVAGASHYLLTINGGTAIRVGGTAYTYSLAANISQNTSADPTLSYSLVAVDALNQSSSAATGTATNAAPAAPTVTLTGGVGVLVAQVTSTPPADFLAYEYVFKRDGTTVRTLESRSSEQPYELGTLADSGTHSWTVTVRAKDAFGQYSTATTPAAVVLNALTIDQLRADCLYRDSAANTFTPPNAGTLAALKDTATGSGGVTYNP